MIEKKPSVFPTKEQREALLSTTDKNKIDAYEIEKEHITNQIYDTSKAPDNDINVGYDYLNQNSSIEEMRKRTDEQIKILKTKKIVQYPELAENASNNKLSDEIRIKSEEQIKLRDAALDKNNTQIENFKKQTEEATKRTYIKNTNTQMSEKKEELPSKPLVNDIVKPIEESQINNSYIFELSQPNYNAPFDAIPLPSQGKTYRNKKANIRIGYMTTADENILTSPNLLKSGEFLEILINRKILEPELRYKDLLIGDRNAIMIWIRATGYGEKYPVTLLDENGKPFESEINLNELKTKNLGAEPDAEGLFDFQFPLSKTKIKFKFLTCGESDDIEKMVVIDKEKGNPIDNTNIYSMEKMIVEVNGSRDRNFIKSFVDSIRLGDGKKFNEYVNKIECGIDLNITVGTPGGSSINTFLPLNINFFWPNINL